MKKLFSIFCCLLLSASMVTQAQLFETVNKSPNGDILHKANLASGRNNAPAAIQDGSWCAVKWNTSGHYIGVEEYTASDDFWWTGTGAKFVYVEAYNNAGGKTSNNAICLFFWTGTNKQTYTNGVGPLAQDYHMASMGMTKSGSNYYWYTNKTGNLGNSVTDYYYSNNFGVCEVSSWAGDFNGSNWTPTTLFSDATIRVSEGKGGYMYIQVIVNNSDWFTIGEPKPYYNVNVSKNPNITATITGTGSFVEGGSTTLTVSNVQNGYHFVRWEDGGNTSTNTSYTISNIQAAHNVTAVFEADGLPQYTITANSNNATYGSVTGGGTYYENDNRTLTATSNNEHLYIFDHWLKSGNTFAGNTSNPLAITVTADATYTAVFRTAAAGTITTTVNNASYGTASASLTGSQPGGTAVTLTATPYGGYAFAGWDDNNDGTVDNTDNPRTVYVDGDKEYVAKFIVETASYASFSFDNPNDNIQIDKYTEPAVQCQTSFYPYGISLVEIIAKNTTRTSKNYLQMYIKTNNFRTYYPEGGSSYQGPAYGTYSVSVPSEYGPVIGNCDNSIYESNYYFVYTGDVTDVVIGYKVETASHGGTCHFQGYEGTLAQRLCSFSSYGADYSNETRSNFATFNNGTITVAEGAGGHPYITIRIGGTLVASIGAPAQPYTLAWDANGGELSGTYTAAGSVNEGTSITAPTATRTGYTFTGWSPAFTGTMPAANTTYTAQWAANTYNVSFAPNGGSGTMTNQAFTYGTAQNLKANTFTGPAATVTYDYNGATGGNSPASATVHATFANWTDGVNSYANEAEVSNLTATNGATVALTAEWAWTESIFLPTPTKTGYTFDHWEYGEAPIFLIADAGEEFTLEEDVTMTAQWNTVTYDLTYDGLEGAKNTNPDTYNVESETITLADPGARDGYAFIGWTINGTPVTEITHGSTGDKTLTANWNKKLSAITLEDNEDNDYYNTFKTTYDGATGLIVTYARQFIAGRWSTLCLPFDVNKAMFSNLKFGSRIYEFKYATGNADDGVNLYFSIAKSIEAGKGYIVNADAKLAGRPSFTFSGVTMDLSADTVAELNSAAAYDKLGGTSTKDSNIELVGTLRKGTLKGTTDGNTYMGLKENKIYYPNIATGSTILAYRGIFRSKKGTLNAERIRIIVDGEEAAELEVINGELQDVQETKKFIENGVLYIERNGIIYDATGRKVE